jgi:hypothetical protein
MLEELLRRSLELELFGCEKAALAQALERYRSRPADRQCIIAVRAA